MSSDHDVQLALRRQRLMMRSAHLRRRLAGQAEVLRAPLALADTARSGVEWLRQHPYALIGPAILLVVLRPARALRWVGRLWWGWRTLRQTGRWLEAVQKQRR